MAKILVHLLNHHAATSHVDIAFEVEGRPGLHYVMNRWEAPLDGMINHPVSLNARLKKAGEVFSFTIEENPDKIIKAWKEHYLQTHIESNIFTRNCADAALWFLTSFCGVPKAKAFALPLSVNHIAFGIMAPSPVPIGVNLPGRVMDLAKYHLKENTIDAQNSACDSLKTAMKVALSLATLGGSIYFLAAGQDIIASSVARSAMSYAASIVSTQALFSATNQAFAP
jgi:hypothetical protein